MFPSGSRFSRWKLSFNTQRSAEWKSAPRRPRQFSELRNGQNKGGMKGYPSPPVQGRFPANKDSTLQPFAVIICLHLIWSLVYQTLPPKSNAAGHPRLLVWHASFGIIFGRESRTMKKTNKNLTHLKCDSSGHLYGYANICQKDRYHYPQDCTTYASEHFHYVFIAFGQDICFRCSAGKFIMHARISSKEESHLQKVF